MFNNNLDELKAIKLFSYASGAMFIIMGLTALFNKGHYGYHNITFGFLMIFIGETIKIPK